MPTSCYNGNEKDGDSFGHSYTAYPHSGSEVFSCLHLPKGELPFNVEEANTHVVVGFANEQCTIETENVWFAAVTKINQCESFNGGNALNANYNGVESMKVSDCGFKVEYFTDDKCQDRQSSLSEKWSTDNNFYCESGGDINGGGAEFKDAGSQDIGRYESTQSFCEGGSYGPYSKDAGKSLAVEALSANSFGKASFSFAEEIQTMIADKGGVKEHSAAKPFHHVNAYRPKIASHQGKRQGSSSQSNISMVSFGVTVGLVNLAVGAALMWKFYKPKVGFEGVEMQSSHSTA